MLSVSVTSRCGSAASRSLSVEYWLWSAMQNSTGSEDFTNGSQNCFNAGGLDANQIATEAPTSNTRSTAAAGFTPARTDRPEREVGETASWAWMEGGSSARFSASAGPEDKPEGRPGQEYCGA